MVGGRKISAIEWPFGGLGTEGRVGAPRLRHAKGPVEQRALIAITDPLAEPIGIQRKWPFGSREARELEQENDRTGRSPGRIRHSLAHDLVTRPHLDLHIFDARPLARLHATHPIRRSP